MEVSTAITLLTIIVILLSVVIVTLLAIIIILLIKVSKLVNSIQRASENAAKISEWFSPVKVFTEAAKAFRSLKRR